MWCPACMGCRTRMQCRTRSTGADRGDTTRCDARPDRHNAAAFGGRGSNAMTLTIPLVPVSPTRTRSRDLSRWLLIAAATLVLCSCRGLDPVSRRPAMTLRRRTALRKTASPRRRWLRIALAAASDSARDAAAVAAIASVPVRPARERRPGGCDRESVVPVGHTTPVAVAARPFGLPVRGPWCPPQAPPMVGPDMNPSCGPRCHPARRAVPSRCLAVRSQAARTDCPAVPGRRPVFPVRGQKTNTSAMAGIRLPVCGCVRTGGSTGCSWKTPSCIMTRCSATRTWSRAIASACMPRDSRRSARSTELSSTITRNASPAWKTRSHRWAWTMCRSRPRRFSRYSRV